MSEFDEWFESHTKSVFKNKRGCFDGGYKLGSKMGYKAGAQSQQAKIDELQAKVDEALKQLDLAYPESWGCCVEQAINILKGNKDETIIRIEQR